MRISMAACAVAGVGLLAAPGAGDFTGLLVQPFEDPDWRDNGFEGLVTWRLYAVFSAETDVLLSVFGGNDSTLSFGSTGTEFWNDKGVDSLTAPQDLTEFGYWSNQWDTYVTIDTDTADGDATHLSPGFAEGVGDLRRPFTLINGGWFVTPDEAPQGEADGGLVLFAQLTVPEFDFVCGQVNMLFGDGTMIRGLRFNTKFGPSHDDCNNNCIPDEGDIGVVSCDRNENGVPDECEGTPCPADVDCSGVVDFADLVELLAAWGRCRRCREDITRDDFVDFEDILALLVAWGVCP